MEAKVKETDPNVTGVSQKQNDVTIEDLVKQVQDLKFKVTNLAAKVVNKKLATSRIEEIAKAIPALKEELYGRV